MSAGRVESIFVYPERRAAAEPRDEVRVRLVRGVDGDHQRAAHRLVTCLSLDQWADIQSELGVELPPETRRSNFVISGIDLAATIGKHLRLGEVEIQVTGEVRPCGRMDEAHAGLRAALASQCRGGVHGRVVTEGVVRRGDPVAAVTSAGRVQG